MTEIVAAAGLSLRFSPGHWFDVAALLLLGITAMTGYFRGLVSMLTWAMALFLALQSGYWLYPLTVGYANNCPLSQSHPVLGKLCIYLVALLAGIALFMLLYFFLRRFFRLLVEQPVDRLFGLLLGVVMGLLLLLLVVSLANLLPEQGRLHRTVCRESRTGRLIAPALERIFTIHPTSGNTTKHDRTKRK